MAASSPGATQPATPGRLAQARRQGLLAISADLVAATAVAAALVVMVWRAPLIGEALVSFLREGLGRAVSGAGDGFAPGEALRAALAVVARAVLPVAASAAGAALLVGVLQTGGWFAPFAGAGDRPARVGLVGTWGAIGRGLLKAIVLSTITWLTLREALPSLVAMTGAGAARSLAGWGTLAGRLALRVVVALLALGALDYLRVWAVHRQALRMTRAEILRERRENEGDERLRARRRQEHREVLEKDR